MKASEDGSKVKAKDVDRNFILVLTYGPSGTDKSKIQ